MSNDPSAKPSPRSSRPRGGELPMALVEWCRWIHSQAVQAHAAAGPNARAWDGKPCTWLDYTGMYERAVIVAAMRTGVWEEPR